MSIPRPIAKNVCLWLILTSIWFLVLPARFASDNGLLCETICSQIRVYYWSWLGGLHVIFGPPVSNEYYQVSLVAVVFLVGAALTLGLLSTMSLLTIRTRFRARGPSGQG